MNALPQLADGVITVRVQDETVVWVEGTGALHLLDPAASAVLALLDGGRHVGEVAALLVDRFQADERRIAEDVEQLVLSLRAAGVLADEAA